MWKITTRGFTLEEVLVMAAMNLLASADTLILPNARNGNGRRRRDSLLLRMGLVIDSS